MWLLRIIKSWKFWITILVLPLALIGCSNLIIKFDSDFESDDQIAREYVQVGEHTVSYLRAGTPEGQRVILLHGTPGDAANWVDILHQVPEGYEYIAIDRPGFGRTTPKRTVTSLDAQASAIEPLMKSGNGEGVILLGHSLGGPIVTAAAAKYPDKIKGIVVAAGALDPDLEEVLFIQHIGNLPPISWLLDSTPKNANRELIDLEDELRLLQPKLKSIKSPVVIVHGTADELVPYENVPFMQRELTGTTVDLIMLEGQNHFLPWNSVEHLQDAIFRVSGNGRAARQPALAE